MNIFVCLECGGDEYCMSVGATEDCGCPNQCVFEESDPDSKWVSLESLDEDLKDARDLVKCSQRTVADLQKARAQVKKIIAKVSK